MGMFDTIVLDRKHPCPHCGSLIDSIQVKAFENALDVYRVKDCVAHAEECRVVKEDLYCDQCRKDAGRYVYLAVERGVLAGMDDTLQEARGIQDDLNLERLILWYHDLYRRLRKEEAETARLERFLGDLSEWFGEGLHRKRADEANRKRFWFIANRRHLQGSIGPLEAISRFLTSRAMEKALRELWEEGQDTLDIYHPEDIREGEECWHADVYQDEINDRCRLNWTWTVISRRQLEESGENEDEQPDWVTVVDGGYSAESVLAAVRKWLRDRGHEFEVRLISPDDAKGSGLIRELRKRVETLKDEKTVPADEVFSRIDEKIRQKTAEFIEAYSDRRKVFHYRGLYGSLVPDAAGDRLVGKVEGIGDVVVYEGKTVAECEERFRESVSSYLTKHGPQ